MHYANKIFPGFDLLCSIARDRNHESGKTVFAQIMSLIPRYEFDKCVRDTMATDMRVEFKCRDQFMVMSFCPVAGQDSLRSIDATSGCPFLKLYSSGIKYI